MGLDICGHGSAKKKIRKGLKKNHNCCFWPVFLKKNFQTRCPTLKRILLVFCSDREPDEQNSVNGKRKSQSDKPSSAKLHKRKKAKKSHKKKQKKKSHKKKKKKKRETGAASSQESECSEGEPPKRKKKRHAKSKKASEGPPASSLDPGSGSSKASSCLSSHSGESDSEEPARKRRKRQASLSERAGDRAPEKRSKRKNWKVAADENSEDSSEED